MIDRKKILITLLGFLTLSALVITKAFYVQVVNRPKLMAYAKSQLERTIKVFPPRGNITDRHGFPLAINVPTYNICTIPRLNHKYKNLYKNLSQIVPELSAKKILEKTKGRKNYTWLARNIKLNQGQVEKLRKLEGLFVDKEYTRFYPNHELLSQSMGFVGLDNNGLSGLEMKYNTALKGNLIERKFYRDAKGRPIKFEDNNSEKEITNPDLVLSIDKDLQGEVESVLKDAVIETNARGGGVGIMDAQSGEILAISNYPSFDLNNAKGSIASFKKLPFITDPIEPGSVFKSFVIASALENNVGTTKSKYYCEKGKFKIGKHTISEAEAHEQFEWLTIGDILKFSSNIGTTKVAFDLKYPRLRDSLLKFNFGEKTGIEIPGESKGIFNRSNKVSQISLSNISFGQGIAVTGIQMLAAYAAIANGGVWNKPTIILKNKDNQDENILSKRIMSEKTATELVKMLTSVVDEGTGSNAKIPHFSIAGKTGTAQRVSETGGYQGYVASFVGFPVNLDRRFVVYVYVDDPKTKYYGNEVAAPIFKKITQYILYKNKDIRELANKNTSEEKLNEKIVIKKTDHLENISLISDEVKTINSSIDENSIQMPNFLGLDKSTAKELASKADIEIKIEGFGIVKEQSVAPSDLVSKNTKVVLKFSPPTYDE